MIQILYAMVRARRIQALTIVLLAAIATIATVAGPAYLHHVDAKVAARQLDGAAAMQRSIEITIPVDPTGASTPVSPAAAASLVNLPGFSRVTSVTLPVTVPTKPGAPPVAVNLVDRQDECAHVTMLSGRCVIGAGEVVLPASLATTLDVKPGAAIQVITTYFDGNSFQLSPAVPMPMVVTGVYAPTSPSDVYWGGDDFFAAGKTPPALTNDATLATLHQGVVTYTIDAIADQRVFDAGLSGLSAQVATVQSRATSLRLKVSTGIPSLITSIQANEAIASRVVPVAAAPLVMLAWFVIFLAAAYAAAGLRFEYGVVALRGAPRLLRWWLAAGENVAMILVGTFVSYGITLLFAPVAIGWALIALAGSLLAALIAVARPVSSAVAPLLRRVPATVRGMGSRLGLIGEVLVVLLAVVAAVQLRVGGGELSGVTLLVPGLIILGTAMATGFAVVPVARRIGHRAMRRGRIATALGAFTIGRRPGAQRILVLMSVAVGLLAFATAGLSVAATGRSDLATVQTGASRVLTLAPVSRAALLQGVHAADPSGKWAMATAEMPAPTPGVPPILAVDAPRLAAVATWWPQYGTLSAAKVAALLHPAGFTSAPTATGTSASVAVTVSGISPLVALTLGIRVVPLDGTPAETDDFGKLTNGTLAFQTPVTCARGCRVDGILVNQRNVGPYAFTLALNSLRIGDADIAAARSGRNWRTVGASVTPAADAPIIKFNSPTSGVTRVIFSTVPSPIPAVATSRLPSGLVVTGFDGSPLKVDGTATVAGLPKLGRSGTFVDLTYADLSANDDEASVDPQVWLGPRAPADAVARLAAHGILVTGSTTVGAVDHDLNEQGPALALKFHLLAALLAIILAIGALLLIAVVDRRPRTDELWSMRTQGVTARTVGRAASSGYIAIAIVAGFIGLGAAALAWWVAGRYLPIFTGGSSVWPPPHWPASSAVAWPWAVSVLVLCAVALGAGADLRRAIRNR